VGNFIVAATFHLRAGDTRQAGTPIALGILASAALVLRAFTL
jgi:hypothetical protein